MTFWNGSLSVSFRLFGCCHVWAEKERLDYTRLRYDFSGKEVAPDKTVIIVLQCAKCGDLRDHWIGGKP